MNVEMEITAAAPTHFTDEERAVFSELVKRGGEVTNNALATNIKNAKAIVLGKCAEGIQGVAALKRPQASYRKRIGDKAGVALGQKTFPYELGYVFLVPEMQRKGLSHRLVAKALEHTDSAGVFATTRADNAAMLATLSKAGFKSTGNDYRGRDARMIRLLVRRVE
jgi:GNAT superfamily N-acetyltransferase